MTAAAIVTGELPQCMRALAHANEIRLARADRRSEIVAIRDRDESLTALAAIVADPDGIPDYLRTVTVQEFIEWAHRLGPYLAGRYARACSISPFRELGLLTERQRGVLARALRTNFEDLGDIAIAGGFDNWDRP